MAKRITRQRAMPRHHGKTPKHRVVTGTSHHQAARILKQTITGLSDPIQTTVVFRLEVHGDHMYDIASTGVLVHNGRANCDELVEVYHYTDKKGFNAISSQTDRKLLALQPGKGNFTTLSAEQVGNQAKAKLGITKSKFAYAFRVRV